MSLLYDVVLPIRWCRVPLFPLCLVAILSFGCVVDPNSDLHRTVVTHRGPTIGEKDGGIYMRWRVYVPMCDMVQVALISSRIGIGLSTPFNF